MGDRLSPHDLLLGPGSFREHCYSCCWQRGCISTPSHHALDKSFKGCQAKLDWLGNESLRKLQAVETLGCRRLCSWCRWLYFQTCSSYLCRKSASLPQGQQTQVLQPLSRPPSRYSDDANVGPSPEAFLPPLLFMDLRNAVNTQQLLSAFATPLATQVAHSGPPCFQLTILSSMSPQIAFPLISPPSLRLPALIWKGNFGRRKM